MHPTRSGGALGILVVMSLVAASCGGPAGEISATSTPASPTAPSSGTPTPGGPTPPSPTRSRLKDVRVRLIPVAALDQPLGMAVRTGDEGVYVAQKAGRIVDIADGRDPRVVLDLTGSVSEGSEQGLLGLAFSPDGRFLYVNYTDPEGDTNVVEYMFVDGRADPSTARRVLFVDQPFSNHNGGNLVFGPDGYLYVGLGDGGSQGDPNGNGQNLGVLLAKMLRIDPRPSGGTPYGIPPDNPFVALEGARPEVWAFGLRNPWRYSFDRATGDLWIGDVGGGEREEIDLQPASSPGGENYGWSLLEGTVEHGTPPPDAVPPVTEYSHDDGGCVVTGGYVYRGQAIPALDGAYLFTDVCTAQLTAILVKDGKVVERANLGPIAGSPVSFGQDAGGELYVICLGGEVFRIDPRGV